MFCCIQVNASEIFYLVMYGKGKELYVPEWQFAGDYFLDSAFQ